LERIRSTLEALDARVAALADFASLNAERRQGKQASGNFVESLESNPLNYCSIERLKQAGQKRRGRRRPGEGHIGNSSRSARAYLICKSNGNIAIVSPRFMFSRTET
jgi:hypothetical protein